MNELQFLATLGVGGVLAGVIFAFYRKDVKQFTDLWKNQTSLLIEVVKENTRSNEAVARTNDAIVRALERRD